MDKAKRAGLIIVLGFTALLVGCGQTRLPRGEDAVWQLVVIGDSSLWRVGRPYAALIEEEMGVKVELADFTIGGLSAGKVLEVLQTGESPIERLEALPAAVGEAEVIVMFVNPEESLDPENPIKLDRCFNPNLSSPPILCAPETWEHWTLDLKSIWEEIFRLRAGKETIIRAVDIYNPLVSPWTEHGVLEACSECWANMSYAARQAAEAYNIPFLSRFDALNGSGHGEDPREKGYILSDGEHLSVLGGQFTAELLAGMGYQPVSPP